MLDADGLVCPDPDNSQANPVTFTASGTPTAWVEGTGNGDPAGLVNNKSPMHPAYHGPPNRVVWGALRAHTPIFACSCCLSIK